MHSFYSPESNNLQTANNILSNSRNSSSTVDLFLTEFTEFTVSVLIVQVPEARVAHSHLPLVAGEVRLALGALLAEDLSAAPTVVLPNGEGKLFVAAAAGDGQCVVMPLPVCHFGLLQSLLLVLLREFI